MISVGPAKVTNVPTPSCDACPDPGPMTVVTSFKAVLTRRMALWPKSATKKSSFAFAFHVIPDGVSKTEEPKGPSTMAEPGASPAIVVTSFVAISHLRNGYIALLIWLAKITTCSPTRAPRGLDMVATCANPSLLPGRASVPSPITVIVNHCSGVADGAELVGDAVVAPKTRV